MSWDPERHDGVAHIFVDEAVMSVDHVGDRTEIESGADSVPVLIGTRDEVGELALSFNRMVEAVAPHAGF